MTSKGPVNWDNQLKDIRRQLGDQLGCLEFRMESKLSLLQEYQEFFRRRGEVEYEYARSIERLCEKFERNTKQRNIRNEVRSTFNLWSTLLAETRKVSRERANLAEVMASEMVARVEVMAKDVQVLTKKCKEMCVEVQDHFLKEIRDLSEQTKVYHHSCHNTNECYNKLMKSKEKLEGIKGTRKKKALEKDMEKQRQFKAQKHLLMKNRNDYLLGVARCNALSMQYFNMDIMDIIEYMDFDYHDSYRRLMQAMREAEYETCEAIKASADSMVEQSKTLNFEGDLHYFLSEYATPFTPPNSFQFTPFQGDDVLEYKVNTEDVFKRAKKGVQDLQEEIQTLQIQREEDVKTIQHMQTVNLKKYQVTTVDDALAVIEENGDSMPSESSRGTASLERGLSLSTRGAQAVHLSQKGKKDTMFFTLGIVQRRVQRADRLSLACAQLDILEKSLDEQKVPPVPVGVDSQGRQIPGEVPKLFGGDIVEYIMATGSEVPLIVRSCVKAIESNGMTMEGLFRVPGPAAYTEELMKGFEEGRDPLAYSQQKPDICAVASLLKAYFRELSIPLFPSDKYREFINCTRHDDIQDRLEAVRQTVNTLPPAVISVMRYLFRFLSRVAKHSTENKMGTANLALVFGPTLMRAPDSIDPRQLHTDVPSVNILIQMCIEQNPLIFGEEEEEDETAKAIIEQQQRSKSPPANAPEPPTNELEASFDLVSKVTVLSTSPPTEPPSSPPSAVPQPQLASAQGTQPSVGEPGSVLPPPPLPPRSSLLINEGSILIPPDGEPPPPRPPKNDDNDEEHTPPPQQDKQVTKEPTPQPVEQEPAQPVKKPTPQPQETAKESTPQPKEQPQGESTENQSLVNEFSDLDKAMEEINDSLVGMNVETAKPSTSDEPSDDDTDSDDEDEEDVLKVTALALYDYSARSDKELSFKKGDILQVFEKTPDHNWWDGHHDGKRGFIPVAYIEILELGSGSATLPVPSGSGTLPVPVPTPPARKSSMPVGELSEGLGSPQKTSTPPVESPIFEGTEETPVTEESVQIKTPELIVESPLESEPPHSEDGPTPVNVPIPSVPVNIPTPTVPESVSSEPPSPSVEKEPEQHGSVRSITKQFQEPQKVLVEPHPHRRQRSTDLNSQQKADTEDIPPRSASTGKKVGKMASVFEGRANAPTAPLVSPKPKIPRPHAPHPPVSSPRHTETHQPPPAFPLMSHPQPGAAGISPLQRIAHQGQQKPPPPEKKLKDKEKDKGKEKDKHKVKRGGSVRGEKGSKPPPPAKPGFVSDFNAELAAKIARKQEHK